MRIQRRNALCLAGRWLLGALVGGGLVGRAAAAQRCIGDGWPLWQEFAREFIQADGRVVDASTPQQQSTSEGQSYAMFFALVANDPQTFDRLWQWSRDNLFGAAQGSSLPAWQWGRASEGRWTVLDSNSAADADMWFAYALIEASVLWSHPDYYRQGMDLLKAIRQEEVIDLLGLGAMLLPGRSGFVGADGVRRLNPSYLPLPVLRRFSMFDSPGPWQEIARNLRAMLAASAQTQLTPDWIGYRTKASGQGEFFADPVHGERGSYDAIRSYLWAGMTSSHDPLASAILDAQRGMAAAIGTAPPESVLTDTGQRQGDGPFGFSAALVPYLSALGEAEKARSQQRRALAGLAKVRGDALAGRQALPYYDYVLSLFGLGWQECRYRFLASGQLQPSWNQKCKRHVSP